MEKGKTIYLNITEALIIKAFESLALGKKIKYIIKCGSAETFNLEVRTYDDNMAISFDYDASVGFKELESKVKYTIDHDYNKYFLKEY